MQFVGIVLLRGSTELSGLHAGGAEVAKFCQEHIAAELLQLEQYKEGKVGESLIRVRYLRLAAGTCSYGKAAG